MWRRLFPLAMVLVPIVATAQISSSNWDLVDPDVKAICKRVGAPRPPAADLPSAAQAKALKGCESEKLYYGEGIRPDYAKARQCAFLEARADERYGSYGDVILMQIYANGRGVKRDLDLATAYACRIEAAPLETEGRVRNLQSLKKAPEEFDFCDDITSGLAAGACAARMSNQAAPMRNAQLKTLVEKLPQPAQMLYKTMIKAFDAFIEAHGDEVDQSGTNRAEMVIEEEIAVRDQFLKDLRRLVSGRWPAASAEDARSADAQLNASYRKGLAWSASKDNISPTKSDDIRKAQRSWLIYRDAFIRFAAAAAPSTSRDAVLARLSRLRTAQLDFMSSD